MKKTNLAVALLSAIGLSAVAAPAMAYEAGDILVRGRLAHISPNDDSGTLVLNGSLDVGEGVKVDSDTIPELDLTYMITKNWGVELILGWSEHTVTGHKSATPTALGDVIETKVLPPTLTLQYHFMPDSNIRPYVGAGINYTHFFSEEVDGDVLRPAGGSIKLEDSWGLAAQVGVDVALNDDWFVNADIKYIQIDTTAKFSDLLGNGTSAKIDADIDPFVFGIGVGRRF